MQKNVLLGVGLASLIFLVTAPIGIWGESAFFILLALVGGIALFLVSLLHERFPLYLLVASLPLAEMLRVDFIPSTLLVIPGGLAVISLLASMLFRKKQVFIHSPILITALLLGVWASIATVSIGSITESRPYWLVIILLFLVPNLLTEEEHFLRASWLFLLPLGALGAYVFVDRLLFYITAQGISMERLHLTNIEAGGKSIVGLWLTLGIPFAFYLFEYYKEQPGKRFWLLISGIAMFAGALATLSIGVVVGLCAMIAMIVWFQPGLAARLRMLVLGIVILVLVFSGPIAERLQNRQLLTFDETWGTYRGALWEAGARTILDHPIFGIGMEQPRRIAMMKYLDEWFFEYYFAQGVMISPHNIFLAVGVDIGLPGLVLYLILLGSVLFSLWRLRRGPEYRENHLIRVFTTILLVALISGWVQGMALSEHLNKFLWFLMGSAIALCNMIESKEKPQQKRIVQAVG